MQSAPPLGRKSVSNVIRALLLQHRSVPFRPSHPLLQLFERFAATVSPSELGTRSQFPRGPPFQFASSNSLPRNLSSEVSYGLKVTGLMISLQVLRTPQDNT